MPVAERGPEGSTLLTSPASDAYYRPVMSRLRIALIAACLALAGCGNDVGGAEPPTHSVTISLQVPDDAPTIYVTGNLPVLGPWHPAALAVPGAGHSRSVTFEAPAGHTLRYRITAGSWEREGLGTAGELLPEFTSIIDSDVRLSVEIGAFRTDPAVFIEDWRGAGVEGELVYWKDVDSALMKETRHVVIWLPPGYGVDADTKYKVIYVHDGQNLFDPRIAYTMVDWGIDEAMMRGVRAGKFEPAIVVGIWNTPHRLIEYSPWHDADRYARFIVNELMPRVESEFAVLTGPENTFVMGASMGGLVSLYLLKEYPDVFGACGCVSSHLSWSEQMLEWYMGRDYQGADATPYIVRDIESGARISAGVRLYLDYGTDGLDAAYAAPHGVVKAWLIDNGLEEDKDFRIREFAGAGHNEAAWRVRVEDQLAWLLRE